MPAHRKPTLARRSLLQKGVPHLARDFAPASVDQAAVPIRIEKRSVAGKIHHRLVGVVWGGSRPVEVLQMGFNPDDNLFH